MEIHSWCCALLWKLTQNWCWRRVFTLLQCVLEFAKQFPLDSVDICFSVSLKCCCNVILFTFYPRLFRAIGVLLLPASVCLFVCVHPSTSGCLCHNLSHVCARITKFGLQAQNTFQGCQRSGKSQGKFLFFKVREKSGNLQKVIENLWISESQGKVREFSDECPQYFFYDRPTPLYS